MRITFSFQSAFSIFLITLLSSCWTTSKFIDRATFDVSKVPADFNPSKHILLFAEMPRLNNPKQRNPSVTNKMDKVLKEKYPHKYEIVSLQDIFENKTKYGDTSVYKYAVLNSLSSVTHSTTTTTTRTDNTGTHSWSVSPSARTTYIDYGFYDRVKGTQYPKSGNSSPKLDYAVTAFIELINRAKQKK